MDKTDRLRDYGLAFLLYEHGLGVCGYELIRELFIFIKLILNSYLEIMVTKLTIKIHTDSLFPDFYWFHPKFKATSYSTTLPMESFPLPRE